MSTSASKLLNVSKNFWPRLIFSLCMPIFNVMSLGDTFHAIDDCFNFIDYPARFHFSILKYVQINYLGMLLGYLIFFPINLYVFDQLQISALADTKIFNDAGKIFLALAFPGLPLAIFAGFAYPIATHGAFSSPAFIAFLITSIILVFGLSQYLVALLCVFILKKHARCAAVQ